jgi:hypothetical protein
MNANITSGLREEERTCQNCRNYGSGGYNFPCNECRQSLEYWVSVDEVQEFFDR